ncbi:uncharacterized protein LOC111338797 [Stylophora pistillata]|uniref:Uncharacterized protein n=1 Tax=Stylophora pistillata TaxID=50429 RepID=A0A2B4RQB3_STYPI|nr:uncharacterized protein LOC111338797 [Stylophora pistillata]PFX18989.1 hypothetical protein AWC38_SpisGene16619 [Stylophora pistillata]
MSIEDRSFDALREGTATVIDGSDYDWIKVSYKLYSMNETESGDIDGHYWHVDSNDSLKANGGKDSANIFNVYTRRVGSKAVVMLQHDKTEKFVAFRKNSDEVYVKHLPKEIDLNNLETAAQEQILFYKIPRTAGGEIFHLQSYPNKEQTVGFDTAGNLMLPSAVQLDNVASFFKIFPS